MSLQFLLGNATANHAEVYIEKAAEWLKQDSENQVFFLVPNYSKFEREYQILVALKKVQGKSEFATLNAQVFSYDRLAWYYLQGTGLLAKKNITATGAAMLMRKVLLDVQSELVLYQGEVDKAGFIEQLLDLDNELATGHASAMDLLVEGNFIDAKDIDRQLKMNDLALILLKYQEALMERGLQLSNPIATLTEFLLGQDEAARPDLSKTLFIATGFQESYAQELQLLAVLMSQGHLLMSLLLDQPYTDQLPEPLDLYFDTGKMYYRLKKMADQQQVPVSFDLKAPDAGENIFLSEVETFWRNSQKPMKFTSSEQVAQQLKIWQVATPEAEVRQVASEIRKLMASGNYRYRQFQVLTADMGQYGELVTYIFKQYEIPFYVDEQKSMEQHPLTAFLEALLALEEYNYRLEDILRLLKTELYLPDFIKEQSTDWSQQVAIFRELLDKTENLALKYNFQGYFWTRAQDWQFVAFDYENEVTLDQTELQKASNQLRQAFYEDIHGFLEKLKKAPDSQSAVKFLYQFLNEKGISDQLIAWREADVASGNLEAARNHEQTWQSLMNLMDEFIEIYQADDFDFTTFRLIFTTGLENSVYGRVPTSLDQVKINQLSLARQKQAKFTFAIGLDEKTFPQTPGDLGLLNSEDRLDLNERLGEESFINDGTNDVMAKSPMIAYKAFLSATDGLYLSYASNLDSEQNLQMSPYLERFVKQLQVPVTKIGQMDVSTNPQQVVASYRSLIPLLNQLLGETNHQELLSGHWQNFKTWLLKSKFAPLAEKAFASLDDLNVPVSLQPQLAQQLYGKDLYSSVSRMESLYHCQYRYFADYGLDLKERDIYGLDAMITGSFFHDALDHFLKAVFEQETPLPELSEVQQTALIDQVLDKIFGEPQFQILNSSARMKYLRYRLSQTVKRVTQVLAKQAQRMHFTPIQTEVMFGQIAGVNGIPGIDLPMNNGGTLHVRGKIDRVDMATTEQNKYLSVVDYKSGQHDFEPGNAYFGLAMQLLTYLDVALMDAAQLVGRSEVKPGGGYYLRIQDPTLNPEKASEDDLMKNFQFKGFFLEDEALMEQMAPDLAPSSSSKIFPVKQLKTGGPKPSGKTDFYDEDELKIMMEHNRWLLKTGGEKIVNGEIKLNPSRENPNKYACQFCQFRSLCGFDVMLKENNYHEIEKLTKEEALDKMKGDLGLD